MLLYRPADDVDAFGARYYPPLGNVDIEEPLLRRIWPPEAAVVV